MSLQVSYRLLRIIRLLAVSRVRLLLLFFLASWLFSAGLFYYVEHVHDGRPDIDFEASLYWALITMATVGYGDIVPSRGLGWAVAGFTAVLGIAVYTLFISTIADRFLEATVKASMGLGRLHGKKIVVVGEGPLCETSIEELLANNLGSVTGWILTSQPQTPPRVDHVVGPLNEETLRRGGAGEAERAIICFQDDSKVIHAAALLKRVNRNIHVTAVARDPETERILEVLGVETIIPVSILGRLLASGGFEPAVVRLIGDATTRKGRLDLREQTVEEPATVEELEARLGARIIAVARRNGVLEVARPHTRVEPGDRIVYLEEVSSG